MTYILTPRAVLSLLESDVDHAQAQRGPDPAEADAYADAVLREQRWTELIAHLRAFAESEGWSGATAALARAMKDEEQLRLEYDRR